MAQIKLTVTRGRNAAKEVTVSAGTPIAGSDAMELNVDYTKASKGDVLIMIERLQQKIVASPWPMA